MNYIRFTKKENNNRVAILGDGGWETKTNLIASEFVKKVTFLSQSPFKRQRPRRHEPILLASSSSGWPSKILPKTSPLRAILKKKLEVRTIIFLQRRKFLPEVSLSHTLHSGICRRGVPPLTLWNKPEVDGYTRSVRGNPGGSRTPSSRSSRQHTKRGPYRGWSKHFA